ncbi:MAG: acyltransferase [Muribaculaceae bacterium]|nr:acyltransferase [Muribaculaceae bacterium]
MAKRNQYLIIDNIKLFLLLGVVSIHCNVLTSDAVYLTSLGANAVIFFSSTLTRTCVPAFFIISGFLFYQNKFSFQSYKDKLYRRFYTLFIPYMLWNLISLILQILKIKYLGFPDHGLFEDGSIQWIKVFEGFYNYVDGYPFAFAFWFIRNLMIFILLSPVAYLISCKKISIGLIFIFICLALNTTLWGFSFFIIGGIIARYFKNIIFKMSIYPSIACGILWITVAIINIRFQFDYLSSTYLFIESISSLIFITYMIKSIKGRAIKSIIEKFVPATFFIYSFHQLYCSVTRNFYIKIFGLDTSSGIIMAYLSSLITLIGLSYLIWITLKRTCPSVLNILCGNRGNSSF